MKARYEALSKHPDLGFADFLRWCIAHWPALPLEWVLGFSNVDADRPGRLEGSWEDRLIAAFAPFFAKDFAPFRAIHSERLARGDWHPDACHAFWLVAWLLGEDIPEDEVEKLGRWRAFEHYWRFSDGPRSTNPHLRLLNRRAGLEDCEDRTLGLALLGMDGWRAALQALMDGAPDCSFERVGFAEAIDPMPLAAAVPRLLEEERPKGSSMAQAYADYLRRRPEPAGELLRIGQELSARDPRPYLAELLCLEAARRLLDAGEPVPAEVDELLTLALRYRAPLPLYRAVLPRLPGERRLALIERDLAGPDSRGWKPRRPTSGPAGPSTSAGASISFSARRSPRPRRRSTAASRSRSARICCSRPSVNIASRPRC